VPGGGQRFEVAKTISALLTDTFLKYEWLGHNVYDFWLSIWSWMYNKRLESKILGINSKQPDARKWRMLLA
jgi:hypothetical protein